MLSQLQAIEFPNWLTNLTIDEVLNAPLPLPELLRESLFYPSCGFDGDPIKHFGGFVLSFVYVDYGHTRDALMSALRFTGYDLVVQRFVAKRELSQINGRSFALRPGDGDPLRYRDYIKEQFCVWAIFQRRADVPVTHGPSRFSLLFICADGVDTFQSLYVSNGLAPKIVAVIQPGHGFGRNWTDFTDPEQALGRVVLKNPAGQPDMVLYGGIGCDWQDYQSPCWPMYKYLTRRFRKSGGGTVGVWTRNPHDNDPG